MTAHTPTGEQQAIIDAYRRGRKLVLEGLPAGLVINAYAGTGKTTILRMLAEADPYVKFLYVAYNKAAKKDAAASFPQNARCFTSHGLAYRPMIHMSKRIGGGPKYVRGLELARLMDIKGPARLTPDKVLAPGQLASVVKATIRKFCYSADETITRWHVPNENKRFTDDEIAALRVIVPPIAQRLWDSDITKADGKLPVDHDHYVALTRAQNVLDCEAVAWLDEYLANFLARPAGSDGDDIASTAARLTENAEPESAAAAAVNGWTAIRDAEVAYRTELADAR